MLDIYLFNLSWPRVVLKGLYEIVVQLYAAALPSYIFSLVISIAALGVNSILWVS